jgi:hypothetical protein
MEDKEMKMLRISDDVHRKMTATVGTLMAQTAKMRTYQDAVEAVLTRSVILPTELLAGIENFIETNKHLGYTTREEYRHFRRVCLQLLLHIEACLGSSWGRH